jgi:septal ring factor EnvC (AmiA/AmiB activator)
LDGLHEEASQLEAEMRSTERQLAEQREAASRLQDEMDQREVHLNMRAQVPRAAPEAEVSQNVLSFVLFGAVVFEFVICIPHFIDH